MSHSIRPNWRTAKRWAMQGLFAVAGLTVLALQPLFADNIITAGADKKVKIWDTEGKLVKEITAHDGAVNTILLSPDNKVLVTAGADKKVKLWKVADGSLIKEIAAHDGAVTSLAFSEDGKKLLTGSADKKVKIWNAEDGKEASKIDAHEDKVVAIFLVAGLTITGGADGHVKLWDGDGNMQFEIPTEHVGGLKAMSGNATKQCLYTAGEDGKIKYWSQAGSGEFEGTQGSAVKVMTPMPPDGKKLLVGSVDGKVKIWDTDDYKVVATINDVHTGGVNAIAVSPDGKMILTGGADKKVKAWGPDGKLLKTIENVHDGAVNAILYLHEKKEEKKENKG